MKTLIYWTGFVMIGWALVYIGLDVCTWLIEGGEGVPDVVYAMRFGHPAERQFILMWIVTAAICLHARD